MSRNIFILNLLILTIISLNGCGSSSDNNSGKIYNIEILESENSTNQKVSKLNLESIIENQAEHQSVEKIALSPKKYGAAVLIKDSDNRSIYLYGLEDPQNPKREYKIATIDQRYDVVDISMKSGGVLEYTLFDKQNSSNRVVKYDYFKAKEISRSSDDDSNDTISIQTRVENAIRAQHEDSYSWQLRQVVLTPGEQGAIVETSTILGSFLYLYGIEDPDNPVEEYLIDMDDMGHAKFTDITMLGDGKVRYTTYNYGIDNSDVDNPGERYVTVTYDYFNREVISRDFHN
jgi:hypothetical protein